MWAGQVHLLRREREEDAATAAPGSPPSSPRPHPASLRGTLGEAGLQPATALPLSPPAPISPPTPDRRPSLGRETSATEGPLLHLLLPLLGPAAGGTAADAAHPPHSSVAACAAKLAVASLGVALVAMPHLLATLGALPALLAVLVVAALTLRSTAALAAAAAACGLPAHLLTYRAVAEVAGHADATVLHVAVALNSLGLLAAHLMAAADALQADDWAQLGAPAWLAVLLRRRAALLPLLAAAALPLLLAGRRMQHHAPVRMLGLAAVLLWASATLYLAGAAAAQGRAHALPPWPSHRMLRQPWELTALQLAAALPVLLTVFRQAGPGFPLLRACRLLCPAPPAVPSCTACVHECSSCLSPSLQLPAGLLSCRARAAAAGHSPAHAPRRRGRRGSRAAAGPGADSRQRGGVWPAPHGALPRRARRIQRGQGAAPAAWPAAPGRRSGLGSAADVRAVPAGHAALAGVPACACHWCRSCCSSRPVAVAPAAQHAPCRLLSPTHNLQMRPLRASLARLQFPRAVDRLRAHAADPGHWRSRALTALLLASACVLAAAVSAQAGPGRLLHCSLPSAGTGHQSHHTIPPAFPNCPPQLPSIWALLQLVGATAGVVIACVLPGALLLRLPRPRGRGGSAAGLLLIAAGLLLCAAGLAGAVL